MFPIRTSIMNTFTTFSLPRRRFVAGLAAGALSSPWLAQAQTAPSKLIRIGSPDLGTAGKPSAGAGTLAIVHANKWLEEEFAKDGIEVQWNFFRGAGPAVAEALAARQLDLVYLGDLASVIHKSRGLPTRYLLPTGRGSNSYLATAPGSNIRSVADLKGKRVSVLKGTAYQRPFDNLLVTAGLTEKDVKLINMDWPSSKAAVVAGQLDATFGGADLFVLRDKGVEIPLSTRGRGPAFEINAGALATEDFVTNQAPLVQRVVKQLVRASHWASQEGNREALIKLFASNSGNPELPFREELVGENLAERYSPLVDDGLISAYQTVLDEGLKLGLVRQGFDVKAWFEPKFVQQALKELKLEKTWRETDASGKAKGAA